MFLIHTQKYKMEERVQTEHNLATRAVYEMYIYIYIYIYVCVCVCVFDSFPFCIYLYFYFQYLSTFKILKIRFILKYNKYHIL